MIFYASGENIYFHISALVHKFFDYKLMPAVLLSSKKQVFAGKNNKFSKDNIFCDFLIQTEIKIITSFWSK